jgi:hypothetical protein
MERLHFTSHLKLDLVHQALSVFDLGLLGQLMAYLQLRLNTLHEYCVLCDQPFLLQPMLMRAVCTRDLCMHQFSSFGKLITTAESVMTNAEISDLLVCMLCHAAKSKHRELVLDPYPCVNSDDGRSAFHPDSKDFNALEKEVDQLLRLRKKFGRFGASWTEHHKEIGAVGTGLIQWTVASNRTYLAVLRDEDRITELSSPYQYLLISATPEAEAKFQELRGLHGSTFAFHGSPVGNWQRFFGTVLRMQLRLSCRETAPVTVRVFALPRKAECHSATHFIVDQKQSDSCRKAPSSRFQAAIADTAAQCGTETRKPSH